jgi:hypothetical protein
MHDPQRNVECIRVAIHQQLSKRGALIAELLGQVHIIAHTLPSAMIKILACRLHNADIVEVHLYHTQYLDDDTSYTHHNNLHAESHGKRCTTYKNKQNCASYLRAAHICEENSYPQRQQL